MPLRLLKVGFLLLFTVTPLLFLPWTSELFEFNKLIFTYLITTYIITLWGIRCLTEKRLVFTRSPLDIPLLLLLFTTLLSLVFSIDVHTSIFGYYGRWNGGFISMLAYCLLYWSFVSNMTRKATLLVLHYSLYTIIAVALYGVFEHFGFSFSCLVITGKAGVNCWVQDVQNRVFATLGQPNWLAAYLVALIFVPISYFLSHHKPKTNILIFSLLFACLIFTKSRSGFLAFGISSLVFWLLNLTSPSFPLKFHLRGGMFGAIAAFITVTVIFTLGFKNPIRDYIVPSTSSISTASAGTALESGGTESGAIRKIVWEGAINIWQESPKTFFIGTGPETFAMAYYSHRPLAHNATSEWELLYNKAHNEFLNQLSTTGLLGLGAYLAVLVGMAIIFLRHREPLTIALFAGWLSISITNFWGFSVVLIQLLLFLLPALAISLNHPDTPTKPASKTMYWLISLPVLIGLGIWLAIATLWLSDYHYASSQKYLGYVNRSDVPEASDLIRAYTESNIAYDLNSDEPFIDSQLADTAAFMAIYTTESDATSSSDLARLATVASQKTLSISPHHPIHYKSAARVYILLSALNPAYLKTADQLLEYAQTLSPTDPRLPYNRAVIAKYQNDAVLAEKFLQDSLKLKSDFGDAILQLRQIASDSAKTNEKK